jgi:hypothetical protein
VVARGDVVEAEGEGPAKNAPPQLPCGGIPVGRRRVVALVQRQLMVAALREKRRPLVLVVGVLDGVIALLRREALVEVLVDGGAPCRVVWH